jgi:hypothetical protein
MISECSKITKETKRIFVVKTEIKANQLYFPPKHAFLQRQVLYKSDLT